MLNLNELKQAIEHDVARRWPDSAPQLNRVSARSAVMDAILELEKANLDLLTGAANLPQILTRLDAATAKLAAAQRALVNGEGA
jgi:hypothetical protein